MKKKKYFWKLVALLVVLFVEDDGFKKKEIPCSLGAFSQLFSSPTTSSGRLGVKFSRLGTFEVIVKI